VPYIAGSWIFYLLAKWPKKHKHESWLRSPATRFMKYHLYPWNTRKHLISWEYGRLFIGSWLVCHELSTAHLNTFAIIVFKRKSPREPHEPTVTVTTDPSRSPKTPQDPILTPIEVYPHTIAQRTIHAYGAH